MRKLIKNRLKTELEMSRMLELRIRKYFRDKY